MHVQVLKDGSFVGIEICPLCDIVGPVMVLIDCDKVVECVDVLTWHSILLR